MDLTMDSTSELEKPLSRIKSFDTIFKESTEFSNLVESHLDKPDFSPAPILLPTDLPDQNKSECSDTYIVQQNNLDFSGTDG